MLWKVLCVLLVITVFTVKSGHALQCYYCENDKECNNKFTTTNCDGSEYCGKFSVQFMGFIREGRGCITSDACDALNSNKAFKTPCSLCKSNFCNGSTRTTLSAILGISSLAVLFARKFIL